MNCPEFPDGSEKPISSESDYYLLYMITIDTLYH